MRQMLTIPGEFCTFNEYDNAARAHYHGAASIKDSETKRVCFIARAARNKGMLCPVGRDIPVDITFVWHVPNRRKDHDNIAFAKKFILDGLVAAGILVNDSHRYVRDFADKFFLDKANPRVEIILETSVGKRRLVEGD